MNLLLVEPDRLLAKAYQSGLEAAGHTVAIAHTAQTAVDAVDARLPDVIILEIQLVSHSGIEFLYELRSYPEWQNIPAVILSLIPHSEFADNWALLRDQLGVHDYLYKPQTTLAKLKRAIDSVGALKK